MPRLILASTSRYRRELLGRLGVPFETASPEVDEQPRPDERPRALAERLAAAKAESVTDGDAVVIGADQVAAQGQRPLGKPGDHVTALRQLLGFQGRQVVFYTAVSVVDGRSGTRYRTVDLTRVRFLELSAAQLDRYLAIEQPYDCAGGFKAEGLGIALFESIESSDPTALLGLPLIWLSRVLRDLDLDPLEAPLRPR